MKSVALVPLCLLAACYGSAPPMPAKIPLPPPIEGAQIGIYSEDRTAFESVEKQASTCPAGHSEGSPACTVTRYNVKEPVTRTYTSATYNNQPISYAQFHVMTDPAYNNKVDRLDDLSRKCTRANIPRYVGLGAFVAGVIIGPYMGLASSTAAKAVFWGGMGVGIGSYTLGYFAFGGRDCNEARDIYNDVNVAGSTGTFEVSGSQLAEEMATLANQFNLAVQQKNQAASASAMQMR